MIPHDAIDWLYSVADYPCAHAYPLETLSLRLKDHWAAIVAMKKAGLVTEFEDKTVVYIDFEPHSVHPHPHTKQLCTYSHDEGFINVKTEQFLRYSINTKILPFHLANMMERSASQPPIERLKGLLWELGPIKCQHGTMPAWYVRQLVQHYPKINAALRSYTRDTSALLFTGQPVPDIYQNLPGIRKVLVVGESLDHWSARPRIDPVLVDNAFRGIDREQSSIPYEMPASNTWIRSRRTGKAYSLRGKQKDFFRYLIEQLQKNVDSVNFIEAQIIAGYNETYAAFSKRFSGRQDFKEILSLENGLINLR